VFQKGQGRDPIYLKLNISKKRARQTVQIDYQQEAAYCDGNGHVMSRSQKVNIVTPKSLKCHILTTVQGRRLVQTDYIQETIYYRSYVQMTDQTNASTSNAESAAETAAKYLLSLHCEHY